MVDNFDIKKYLAENKLNLETKITSPKVQEVYSKIIEAINKVAKTLTMDENVELRDKLTDFFTGKVFEGSLEQHPLGGPKAGLIVRGETDQDNTKIGQMVKDTDLTAKLNDRQKYWFFPGDGDMYDALEQRLQGEFDKRKITASIEGVF
jgi:hypothetical protein